MNKKQSALEFYLKQLKDQAHRLEAQIIANLTLYSFTRKRKDLIT